MKAIGVAIRRQCSESLLTQDLAGSWKEKYSSWHAMMEELVIAEPEIAHGESSALMPSELMVSSGREEKK